MQPAEEVHIRSIRLLTASEVSEELHKRYIRILPFYRLGGEVNNKSFEFFHTKGSVASIFFGAKEDFAQMPVKDFYGGREVFLASDISSIGQVKNFVSVHVVAVPETCSRYPCRV